MSNLSRLLVMPHCLLHQRFCTMRTAAIPIQFRLFLVRISYEPFTAIAPAHSPACGIFRGAISTLGPSHAQGIGK